MNIIRLLVFVAVLLCSTTQVLAAHKVIYLVIGQSNAVGRGTGFTPVSIDNSIEIVSETAVVDDAEPDFTTSERPVGTPASAPRWLQNYTIATRVISPESNGKFGPEIQIGRKFEQDAQALGQTGTTLIAKYAVSASSMTDHWVESSSVDLLDRFVIWLSRVEAMLTARGDTFSYGGLFIAQGESDANDMVLAQAWYGSAAKLVERIRGLTSSNLMVVVARTSVDMTFLTESAAAVRAPILAVLRQGQTDLVNDFQPAVLINTDTLIHCDAVHYCADQYDAFGQRLYRGLADFQAMKRPRR